jgi:hypothetical protein
MIEFRSFQKRLTEELANIEAAIVELWRKSGIEEFRNDPYNGVVFITHQYYWKTLAPEHRDAQAKLIAKYRHWCELFNRCYAQHGSDVQRDIRETNDYATSAIELQTGWSTEATMDQNAAYLAKKLAVFRQLLVHTATNAPEFVLVPDTNALLISADPAHYADVVSSKTFRFVIAPTVLAELDELKRLRAAQSVGVKAEKAIRVIKGWRKQGSVLEGVTVSKTITVQMIPTEPRMPDLPSWLDAENKDDRIIGTVLEIQCAQPAAVIILVTDDMNLQNKAEMSFLPWAEPPEIVSNAVTAST